MTKKSTSRFTGLLMTLAITFTASGWIPFTAPVTIETSPEGAEVFEAGSDTLLGVTPFYTRVFLSKKQLEIRMNKFYTEEVLLDHQTPKNIFLTLRPTPVLVYTKPAAGVYPEGSDTPLTTNGASDVEVFLEDKNYTIKTKNYFDQDITIGLSTDSPQIIELEHRPFITISTKQSGVDIYENGSFLAKAPVKEEILKPRTFEFRKEGYFKKTITLTRAQTHELDYKTSVELEPLPVITIKAEPADADIYMVGKSQKIGTGSVELMIEKEAAFEVKADRYYSKSVTADLRTQTIRVALDAMPYVTISSSPSGAAIAVNGKSVGTTPVEQLIENPVSVELTKEGYFPKTVTLDKSDLTPMVSLEKIPPPPVITISSIPTGAAVSVDGKPVGVTPVEQVVENPITVILTMEDYHSQTHTFDGSNLTPSITLVEKSFWQKLFGK